LSLAGISRFVDSILFGEMTEDIWTPICARLKGKCRNDSRSDQFMQIPRSKIFDTFPSVLNDLKLK
jgi:hypothetical protein